MSVAVEDVVRELEQLGTGHNQDVYRKHGVSGNVFGVSLANLLALGEKYRGNHELALALWESGNHDARLLATMIADPAMVTSALAESWQKTLDNYVITDGFTGLIAKTTLCRKKMERWTKAKAEWTSRAGFGLLAHLAMRDGTIPNEYFEGYLEIIAREIHARKNRTREAMNTALIAIGMRNPELERKALAAAERIGTVTVDHGETGGQTPHATHAIRRARENT
jgi:3-methyladenine DNA glycosylase AlkD